MPESGGGIAEFSAECAGLMRVAQCIEHRRQAYSKLTFSTHRT